MDRSGLMHAIVKYQPAEIRNLGSLLEEIWLYSKTGADDEGTFIDA
jgi:hypothetical protein